MVVISVKVLERTGTVTLVISVVVRDKLDGLIVRFVKVKKGY